MLIYLSDGSAVMDAFVSPASMNVYQRGQRMGSHRQGKMRYRLGVR